MANEEQKRQLDIIREDDQQLLVAQVIGNEEKEKAILKEKLKGKNYETLKDVLRIATHREDIETFKKVVGIIWRQRGTNQKNDTVNAFIDAVVPGCIGRQKSKQFLEELENLLQIIIFAER